MVGPSLKDQICYNVQRDGGANLFPMSIFMLGRGVLLMGATAASLDGCWLDKGRLLEFHVDDLLDNLHPRLQILVFWA